MIVAVELAQKAIDPMIAKKFGRIVNITSGSVKAPIVGLDLSSGARAGLTAFFAGVARNVAAANVTINFLLPGVFATDRFQTYVETTMKKKGVTCRRSAGRARRRCSGAADRRPGRVRRGLRVSLLGAGRLHHRPKSADRRWSFSGCVLEHDAEQACPGLAPGWKPVFGKDHAPM